MNIPANLKYTKDHEWVREEDGIYVVGITAFAAEQLGDITYVEVPEVGTDFNIADEVATVESVKAASDIYAPISGCIIEVNEALEDQPELVDENPYGDGWFFKMKSVNPDEFNVLMDAKTYELFIQEQDH